MNPYQPSAVMAERVLHNENREPLRQAWQMLCTVVLGLNPLIGTIVVRRASLEAAGIAFIAILGVTLFSASSGGRSRLPLLAFALYAQSLHWLVISVGMLCIRTYFGYLTAIGELLKLDEVWLWKLLGFSVCSSNESRGRAKLLSRTS